MKINYKALEEKGVKFFPFEPDTMHDYKVGKIRVMCSNGKFYFCSKAIFSEEEFKSKINSSDLKDFTYISMVKNLVEELLYSNVLIVKSKIVFKIIKIINHNITINWRKIEEEIINKVPEVFIKPEELLNDIHRD